VSHEALKTVPIFERTGECNRFCARCCSVARWKQHPGYDTLVRPLFEQLGENARGECLNLDWRNGMAECRIYETRPEVCRVFPNHPLSISIIPECTFQFREKEE
jgi:Fe-S-cluster containining protein